MSEDNISIKKGKAVCYLCRKDINEDIYLNGLDRRYYCCREHALQGKALFSKEQEEKKKKLIEDRESFNRKVTHDIELVLHTKVEGKKGVRAAKNIFIYKATSEAFDNRFPNYKSLDKSPYLEMYAEGLCRETICILKTLIGKSLTKGESQQLNGECDITSYNALNANFRKDEKEIRIYKYKINYVLTFPDVIDFLNFDKFKVSNCPLIILSTIPSGKVIVTPNTLIKIIHENPLDSLLVEKKKFSRLKDQVQIESWLEFSDEIRNFKKIHYFSETKKSKIPKEEITDTIFYTAKHFLIQRKVSNGEQTSSFIIHK
ncbi:MAG: hypothetical protein V1702_00845 [Candidatus Woesearchaeota archaeon]